MSTGDWEYQLDQIQSRGVNLTSWEIDFIESIQSKVDKYSERDSGVHLSDAQIEKIEDIYTKRVP